MSKDLPSERELKLAVVDILNPENTHAYSVLLAIQGWLVQFKLIGRHEAHDILNEAFLRGVTYCKTKGPIARPHPWLKRTAYNIIREWSRDHRRQVPMDPQKLGHCLLDEEGATNQLATQIAIERQLQTLNQALRQLKREKPEEYQLLDLFHFKGLSWTEIRQLLYGNDETTPNEVALRQRLSRLRRRLRRLFHKVESR